MSHAILSLKNMSRNFKNKKVLDKLDIEFSNCSKVLVVGENASGKSTLLKLLAGQIKPSSGRIFLNNVAVEDPLQLKKSVSYLPASSELFPRLTGLENLETMMSFDLKLDEMKHQRMLKDWSCKAPFRTALSTPGYLMSSGMKQMLLIYKSLLRSCSVYVFDEPWNFLSLESKNFITSYIGQHFKNALFVIAAHHEVKNNHFYDFRYELKEGRCDSV